MKKIFTHRTFARPPRQHMIIECILSFRRRRLRSAVVPLGEKRCILLKLIGTGRSGGSLLFCTSLY